jgi:hypothetical protein
LSRFVFVEVEELVQALWIPQRLREIEEFRSCGLLSAPVAMVAAVVQKRLLGWQPVLKPHLLGDPHFSGILDL